MIIDKEQKVYDVLEKLEIDYIRYEHKPIYTIEEANNLEMHIKGGHCKNLFIRNRKGTKHYLVILTDSKKVDLKCLQKQIGSTNLSFASQERLLRYLNLTPGAVTPFGLINDIEKHVEVLIDSDLEDLKNISFHPNVNTATVTISYNDFQKYLTWCGNKVSYVEID